MASIALGVEIDAKEVTRLFKSAPEVTTRRVRQLIEGSAIDVQREMTIAANVGVTGNLRRSVRYKMNPAQLEAEIKPDANYADAVEYGTKPHYVSVRPGTPLAQWARLKGINPYALQRSIARKGTKPHPFVKPTYNKMRPRVINDIATGMAVLAKELDNGISR